MSDFIATAISIAYGTRCPETVEGCPCCDAWAQYDALMARPQPDQAATHRHKKRGTEYVLIGIGKMQTESWIEPAKFHGDFSKPVDMRQIAIYRSVDDGSFWARPVEEFNDGRFDALGGQSNGA